MGHYIEESNQLCQDKSLIYSSLFWAYDRPELKTKDLLSKTTQNSLQGAEVGLAVRILKDAGFSVEDYLRLR
jgi:hypothetical protein